MPIEEGSQTAGQIDVLSGFQLVLQTLGFLAIALVILGVLAFVVGYIWVIWMRNKNRCRRANVFFSLLYL